MKRAILLVCLVACTLAGLGLAMAAYPTFAEHGLALSAAKGSIVAPTQAGLRPGALSPAGATPTPGALCGEL